MRVGIFGGSFDPVHQGHLILAEQCREQGELDEVWFVPAARPPHKLAAAQAGFGQRVEMLELALAGHPAFRVNQLENERTGPSYTADTLDLLARQHPEHEWALLVGGDTLRDLHTWYEPGRIVARASLLVMARPGAAVPSAGELEERLGTPVRLSMVDVPLIDISSSDIRTRLSQGRSIRYLLPRAVEVYAQEKKLYRP